MSIPRVVYPSPVPGAALRRDVRRTFIRVLLLGGVACSPGRDTASGPLNPAIGSAVACTPGASRQAAALLKIDSSLTLWTRQEEIPAVAAGIVCGNALVWSAGYGIQGAEGSTRISPTTRIRIASITRLLTATAILQLRDAGALTLDDPVRLHLPWFLLGRGPDVGDTPVTIRHLLTHTGGLPRDSRLTDPSRRFQPGRREAISAFPGEALEATPGTRYSFSNLGYSVLGEVIAAVTGRPFSAVIRDSLLVPLGMTRTQVQPIPADTFLPPHARGDSAESVAAIGFRDMGFAVPAGGLVSSVEDLGRFVVMQLAPYRGEDPLLLADSSIFAMHRTQFVRDSARGGVGFGWSVDTSSNGHVVYDGGETPEQNAYLAVDLPRGIGVILLTNVQGIQLKGRVSEILKALRSATGP